jgi:hypothetical protein
MPQMWKWMRLVGSGSGMDDRLEIRTPVFEYYDVVREALERVEQADHMGVFKSLQLPRFARDNSTIGTLLQGNFLVGLFVLAQPDNTGRSVVDDTNPLIPGKALDGLYLNRAVSQALFGMLKSAKCFRSLEVFELNGFDFRRLGVEAFAGLFGDVLQQHRFLHRIAFSDLRRPMPILLSLFSTTAFLAEVLLTGLDMSEQSECFVLPANARLLNLSRCHFTWTSLTSLFGNLSRSKSPLTLVLQDLRMPAHHLLTFMENLPSIPQMCCIQELDCSGNPLPEEFVPQFADCFFGLRSIKFLAIGRVFRLASLPSLSRLLALLPRGTLWGAFDLWRRRLQFCRLLRGVSRGRRGKGGHCNPSHRWPKILGRGGSSHLTLSGGASANFGDFVR